MAECAVAGIPVPVNEIVAGEFVALLATVTLPVTPRMAAGANIMLRLAVAPGATICPPDIPLAVNPAPDIVTLEIVTLEFPELVNVTPKMLLLPRITFPKGRLVVLGVSIAVAGFTVRTAGLLVALPAELVTVTLNAALSSEEEAGGVVYEAEFAPLIARLFLLHWYVSVPLPVAATLKVAVWPAMTATLAGCPVIAGATADPVGFEFDLEAPVIPAQPVRIASETSAASNRAAPGVSLRFTARSAFRIKVQHSAHGPVIMPDYELTRNGCYWPPGQTKDRYGACPFPGDV